MSKKKKKKTKNNILLIIIICIIAFLGILFIVKSRYDERDVSYKIYKASDGKEIKLKHYLSGSKNDVYEIIKENDTVEVELIQAGYPKDGIISDIAYGDNCWYLLDVTNNKIISYYESNGKLFFNRIIVTDSNEERWLYNVYKITDIPKNETDYVHYPVKIVDAIGGDLIILDGESEKEIKEYNNNLYIISDKDVKVYNIKGQYQKTITHAEMKKIENKYSN